MRTIEINPKEFCCQANFTAKAKANVRLIPFSLFDVVSRILQFLEEGTEHLERMSDSSYLGSSSRLEQGEASQDRVGDWVKMIFN
jgi:hypothetical protein